MQQFYEKREHRYVYERLQPLLELTLNPVPDERSFEQRAAALKQNFAHSDEGRRLRQSIENDSAALWEKTEQWVDATLAVQAQERDRKDKGISRLKDSFRDAYER